jgi:hypothetical protein
MADGLLPRLGASLAVMAWRTGGLEVPVLVHMVNNVLLLVPGVLLGDLAQLFNRGPGAGGPIMLVPMILFITVTALVEWWRRRSGVPRRSISAVVSHVRTSPIRHRRADDGGTSVPLPLCRSALADRPVGPDRHDRAFSWVAATSAGVPVRTMAPVCMMASRSASSSTSSRYWVVITMVPACRRFRTSCQTRRRLWGSSPVVGSSRNSTSGWPRRATARSSRRLSPPDSCLTVRQRAARPPGATLRPGWELVLAGGTCRPVPGPSPGASDRAVTRTPRPAGARPKP